MKKKNVKLVACLSLTGFLALCGLPYMNNSNYNIGIMESQAAEITNMWESGNTTVTLNSEGTLTVTAKTGTDGRMADYDSKTNISPWTEILKNTEIKEVKFDKVTYIGKSAFSECLVKADNTTIDIGDTVQTIGKSSFNVCTSIKKIIIPNQVEKIDRGAFYRSGLEDITLLSKNAKTNYAFSYCENLKAIHLSDIVTDIYAETFAGCKSITSIDGTSKLDKIGMGAFGYDFPEELYETIDWNNLSYNGYKVSPGNFYCESLNIEEDFSAYARMDKTKNEVCLYGVANKDYSDYNNSRLTGYIEDIIEEKKENVIVHVDKSFTSYFPIITNSSSYSGGEIIFIIEDESVNNLNRPLSFRSGVYILSSPSPIINGGEMKTWLDSKASEYGYPTNAFSPFDGVAYIDDIVDNEISHNIYALTDTLILKDIDYKTTHSIKSASNNLKIIDYRTKSSPEIYVPSKTYNTDEPIKCTYEVNSDITEFKSPMYGTVDNLILSDSIESVIQDRLTLGTQIQSNNLKTLNVKNAGDIVNFKGIENLKILDSLKPMNYDFSDVIDLNVKLVDGISFEAPNLISANETFKNFDFTNSNINVDFSKLSLVPNMFFGTIFRDEDTAFEYSNIPDSMFQNSNIKSITVTEGSIGTNAFSGCTNLEEVIIEEDVTNIGSTIFSGTTNLTKLTIPSKANLKTNSLEKISGLKEIIFQNKFSDCGIDTCTNLEKIYLLNDINSNVTKSMFPSTAMIYCIANSTVETWCKNNNIAYKTLTDDEVDEIQNGKRPIINQFNLLFDKQNPSDLQFDFDLGSGQLGAKSIKNIIINGKKLIKDTDFTITDSTITLNKSIFETLTNDTYQVIINFNNEYTIENKVKIIVYGEDVILTPDKTVPEQTIYIDKSNLEDAYFTVYCDSIDKVIINNKQLKTEEWELTKKTQLLRNGSTENPKELIIKKSVLNALKPNEYNVTIVTEGVTLKNLLFLHITGDDINDEPPIILDTIKYEFYKDYPDFIVIPFSFNRASSITEVKIGSNILDSAHYDIVDSTIIINKDYLSTLDIGKYIVSVTFDDNTKRSNAQLIIYEKAADRAAPYLLQSHIIFNGNSINLTFDPGEGDLQTTNVLALVLDNELILPNGDKVDFNSSNINKLQKAYEDYTNKENEEEVASPSNAKKEETNINNNENNDREDTNIKEDESIDNENNDSENTNINEDESNINDTKEINTNQDNIDNENTNINEDETIKEEDNLIKVEIEQVESNSFNLFATLDDYNTVFVTNGTEITLDGAYIESLNLSEGDHLIGAIFDNTERTTDVKKVILTIPKTDSGDKPTPPDDSDKEEPVNPPKPDEGNKPTPPDNNNGGGSSGGGSSSGGSSGSNSKPDNNKPSPINPDGSLNPDYKPVVPDTGGKFEGEGDDWTYIKPDGNQAKNEWVGDGEDWYYIDENSKLKYDWALINNEWYMLNREHDGKFGAAKYGWYKENQDGQWYFMNPKDTKMLTGWQKINHKWYYFNVNQEEPTYYGDNQSGWKYDATKGIRPHGSMYAKEITPDGYKTNEKGEWIE